MLRRGWSMRRDVKDRRGSAVLSAAARAEDRGCGIDDCERILQAGVQGAPMEFAVEAQKLLAVSLEGSVG